jgi:hypothetical protein
MELDVGLRDMIKLTVRCRFKTTADGTAIGPRDGGSAVPSACPWQATWTVSKASRHGSRHHRKLRVCDRSRSQWAVYVCENVAESEPRLVDLSVSI